MNDTTETAAETVRVLIGWDDDHDAPWVAAASEGDGDGSDNLFDVDVPKELWEALEEADAAALAAHNAVIAASGVSTEPLRLVECCPSWRGHVSPDTTGARVVLAASGRDDVWPLHEVNVAWDRDRDLLQLRVDSLPDPLFILEHGHLVGPIDRSKLTVQDGGHKGWTSNCYVCGWARSEHADAGQVVE